MDYTNSFILFKNEKKSEKSPDYTGEITLEDGTKKRLAAWIKQGKNGKFMTGKISEPQERSDQGYTEADKGYDRDYPF